MTDDDITEDHEIITDNDLDPEMVCRLLDKINTPSDGPYEVGVELAEVLDISEIDAQKLVEDWREPDWPIEYTTTFRVNDVDVYDHFEYDYRGYEPHFVGELGPVYATWKIDRSEGKWGPSYNVELVEVNGHEIGDDQ